MPNGAMGHPPHCPAALGHVLVKCIALHLAEAHGAHVAGITHDMGDLGVNEGTNHVESEGWPLSRDHPPRNEPSTQFLGRLRCSRLGDHSFGQQLLASSDLIEIRTALGGEQLRAPDLI